MRILLILSSLLLATTAQAFLLFQPSFDAELLEGRWIGSFTHDATTGLYYTWDAHHNPDGTVDIYFEEFEQGETIRSYSMHGTWWADEYRLYSEMTELRENGETRRTFQNDTYKHVELTETLHVYEGVETGVVFTARRVDG